MESLSQKAKNITPSVTLAISAKAKEMCRNGEDVVIFGAGEPDFDTPAVIKQAAISAIEQGFTKYTPASGTIELKEAVVAKLRKDSDLDYSPHQVVISCGAKHALYNIFQAICDPGDEVIIFSPYWVSYPEMIKLAAAVPVVVNTSQEDGFCPRASSIRSALSPRTKAIVINSPCNPTGSIYDQRALREIADIAIERDILIVSDEVYEKIIFDSQRHESIAALGKQIKQRTLIVNAVSKTYAMTGWRIGYTVGPAEIIKAMGNIQSHSTSNPTSIAQKAALAALNSGEDEISLMVGEFQKRRDFVVQRLERFNGVSFHKPQGAFYFFLNIAAFLGQALKGREITSSLDFANYLLEEAKVAVVPGAAFGADPYIRISFATSTEELAKGLDRIETAVLKMGVF